MHDVHYVSEESQIIYGRIGSTQQIICDESIAMECKLIAMRGPSPHPEAVAQADGTWQILAEDRETVIHARLIELDNKSLRALRALVLVPESTEDKALLVQIESEAQQLRKELREIEGANAE